MNTTLFNRLCELYVTWSYEQLEERRTIIEQSANFTELINSEDYRATIEALELKKYSMG